MLPVSLWVTLSIARMFETLKCSQNRISGVGSVPDVMKMFTCKESLSKAGRDAMIIQSKIASFLFLLPTSGRGTTKGRDKVKNRQTQVEEIGWML